MRYLPAVFSATLVMGASLALARDTLTAIPVTYPPLLDGVVSEAFWSQAPLLELSTEGGGKWKAANASESKVQLRAVYTQDSLHILLRWADPTYSIDRQRWAFDGTKWAKDDQTSLDKGGANTLYEDKLAMLWVINAPTVVKDGDFWGLYVDEDRAKQAGYNRPVKSAPQGETLDMWHWKFVRNGFTTPGQVDDQYVDSSLSAKDFSEAGRKSDPQPADKPGGYYNNDKQFDGPGNTKISGPRYYVPNNPNVYIITQDMIDRGDAREIPDYAALMSFAPGTKFPGVIGRAHTGSRGDITAAASWADGWYTLELSRKLNTGDNKYDVLFTDLSSTYYFGVATFDNAQIAHGFTDLIDFKFRR